MVEVVFHSEEDRLWFLRDGVIPGYLEGGVCFSSGPCDLCFEEYGDEECQGHVCHDADVLCDLREALLVVRCEDEIPAGIVVESSLCMTAVVERPS